MAGRKGTPGSNRRRQRAAGSRVIPVILSGGAGRRLWPISRALYPKQLLPLLSAQSMLQQTAMRVADTDVFEAPVVVCNEEHRFVIAEQLREIGVNGAVILVEPVGRNTAAAIAVSALQTVAHDPAAVLLVLPADHVVRDKEAFKVAVQKAVKAAAAGHLVTFGVHPTRPETGFGYIRQGAELAAFEDVFEVAAFVEKPPAAVARRFLRRQDYFWNSGMFLFSAEAILGELDGLAPAVVKAARAALESAVRDLDFVRLDGGKFATAPNVSIDRAVMEKTRQAAVLPVDVGWADIGAWQALCEISEKDEAGNATSGDVVLDCVRNAYVRSDGVLTAVLGLDDVIVVTTEDAVLVAAKDRVHALDQLVAKLDAANRVEAIAHRTVYRPWGSYKTLHQAERCQVKQITVRPGGRLSLQKHFHRSEHWVVVRGTALVTRNSESLLVRENESVYIPIGTAHRLENPGKIPLNLIEVQSGAYLGEDDIVRIEDSYGRKNG